MRIALPEGAEPAPKRTYWSAHLTYKAVGGVGGDAEADADADHEEADVRSVSVDLSGSVASGAEAEARVALARNRGLLVSILEKAVHSK